ncbi:carbohydrate ABC transporter permease, partial [Salmonella enterica]|uniref:carbohydrate ABC transporter permease n=1 Tax=Salmonella enterica TaxID=28901 RepID=UPI0020A24C09
MVFVWMHLGQQMLLFTAGLESIDEGFREAARLDGASEAQVFRLVVLPLLRPTILFVTVTTLITAISYFALVLVMTEGGPAN